MIINNYPFQYNLNSQQLVVKYVLFITGMKARLMLSALAWNYRPKPIPFKPVKTTVVWTRRRGDWLLRKTSQQQPYAQTHMPMLMERVSDVFMRNMKLPSITVPAGVAVLGASVPKPTKEELLASRVSRFVTK